MITNNILKINDLCKYLEKNNQGLVGIRRPKYMKYI